MYYIYNLPLIKGDSQFSDDVPTPEHRIIPNTG